MGVRINFPFVGDWAEGRTTALNAQKTINWYLEVEESGSKSVASLMPTPGLKFKASAGNGPCRSNGVVWRTNDRLYFVSGANLVEMDENFVVATIGTLNTQNGRCSIAAGRNYLMVVDGTNGYSYDGTTFAVITDADFPDTCDWVEWLDSYFIVNSAGTEQFFLSSPDDPTAWAALDFASAEKRADKLLRPIWFRGDLLLLGETTAELYYNSGNADFPFDPFTNVVYDWGTPAAASAASMPGDNGVESIFWLAQSKNGGLEIIRAQEERPNIISNKEISWRLDRLNSPADAIGFCYRQAGHAFYQISFTADKLTLVWDDTTGMWHERRYKDENRHRANGHAFYQNKHIVGDFENNNFYEYDMTTYTDNNAPIIRTRRAPVIDSLRQTISHNRLDLEFDFGEGLVTGQGSDPEAMLKWSDDGGKTYKNELWRKIGKVGEYGTMARWHMLGSSRQRVYQVSISDPVQAILVSAHLDLTMGVD